MAAIAAERKRAGKILGGLLACAVACMPFPGLAQSPRAYDVDIARMPLSAALRQFSLQTGLQIGRLVDRSDDAKVVVGPVRGRHTAEEALHLLLTPAGYSFQRVNESTIAVIGPTPASPPRKGVGTGEERPGRQPEGQAYLANSRRSQGLAGDNRTQEEILVTSGRLIHSGEGPAPIMVFDRRVIEDLGVSTVPEVLEYVLQQPYDRQEGYRITGEQYAELRGLGVDTTLVLINGRRTVPSATSIAVNAFDLNSIPLPAVERIEVLSDSVSSVYGADAMGGVINIILKDTVSRPEVDLRYGAAEGGADERRASLMAGYSRERARAAIVLDYFEREQLLGSHRERWSNQDYRRYGSVDQRATTANPGTILSVAPTNLPGLPSRFASVPVGSNDAELTPADFQFTAGQHNRDSLHRFWSIVPESERGSVTAFGQLDLADETSAFLELLYADRSTTFQLDPAALRGAIVPATNPFNPFGVAIVANYLFTSIGPRSVTTRAELLRTVAGMRTRLGSWDGEFSLLRSEEGGSTSRENEVDPYAASAALASSDPERALNVFRDGPAAGEALLDSLIAQPQAASYSAEGVQASALLHGTVFKLPAGPLSAVLGAEWREEDLLMDDGIDRLSLSRDVLAAFAELRLPLVGARMQLPMMNELSLSFGARLDGYSDFGATFNPQYGIVWRPVADLAVRATYGTSFRPPSLFELYMPERVLPVLLADRRRQGEVANFAIYSAGNPALDPARADSLSAGIVLTPAAVSAMRITVSYWRIQVNDQIASVPALSILADEDRHAGRVWREEPTPADLAAGLPGRLAVVDVSRANTGTTRTDGVDFEAVCTFDTHLGQFTPRLSATWVRAFETSDTPGGAPVDRVGVASAFGTIPRWQAVASLGWNRNVLGLAITVRQVAAYADTMQQVRTGRTVPLQATVDFQSSLALDELLGEGPLWRGLELRAGVLNAFDEQANFSESSLPYGYDLSQGDLRQRFAYIRISKQF